jgi:DNA-directed RNA polymerase specialized sigma24 family protein
VITVTGGDRSIDVADAPDGATVEDLLRACAPQVLGTVARRFGDFAAADDAVQEALVEAALRWPSDGVPRNPRGWLIRVAVRKLTDQIRSEQARRRREALAVRRDAPTASAAKAVAGGAVEAAALAAAAAGDGGVDGGGGATPPPRPPTTGLPPTAPPASPSAATSCARPPA